MKYLPEFIWNQSTDAFVKRFIIQTNTPFMVFQLYCVGYRNVTAIESLQNKGAIRYKDTGLLIKPVGTLNGRWIDAERLQEVTDMVLDFIENEMLPETTFIFKNSIPDYDGQLTSIYKEKKRRRIERGNEIRERNMQRVKDGELSSDSEEFLSSYEVNVY